MASKNNVSLSEYKGLEGGKLKQRKVYDLLKRERVDIALLQESHLYDSKHLKLKHSWIGRRKFFLFTTSRGVVVLIHNNLPFQLVKSSKDKYGRFVILKGILHGEEITIMNMYCPLSYSSEFLTKVFAEFAKLSSI